MVTVKWETPEQIAQNDQGWTFWVARLRGRWFGLANFRRGPGSVTFAMPEVACTDGFGFYDKSNAVLCTINVARDATTVYGGITEYSSSELARIDPEVGRCRNCLDICCDSTCLGNGPLYVFAPVEGGGK